MGHINKETTFEPLLRFLEANSRLPQALSYAHTEDKLCPWPRGTCTITLASQILNCKATSTHSLFLSLIYSTTKNIYILFKRL